MKKKKPGNMLMLTKMILSYSGLVLVLLLAVFGTLAARSIRADNADMEKTIRETAITLADSSFIRKGLEKEEFNADEMSFLSEMNDTYENIDYIVVVNKQNIRIFHPQADLIGKPFAGNDGNKALAGADPYITEQIGVHELQKRCFAAVYDENHIPLGFVMVSTKASRFADVKKSILISISKLFVVFFAAGILSAYFIARSIRSTTLGLEPFQLRDLYVTQKDVLNSLHEGVIASDMEGKRVYANDSAGRLIGDAEAQQTFLDTQLKPYLTDHQFEKNKRIRTDQKELLLNYASIPGKNEDLGYMLILHDRTKVNEMAEELTGVRHIIDALRATTHEYKNKLHVILGLLQLGETESAVQYISDTNTADYDTITKIYDHIHNKTIAALLLGKISRAKELNIVFHLRADSHLDAHNPYLEANDIVTILGNLIENSFDAMAAWNQEKEVTVFIRNDEHGIIIETDDTGPGMDQETINRIYQGPYTTKGTGHGIGLSLIRKIITQADGSLEIESAPGEGTSFTITITKKRPQKETL